jgi:hypothetical protein
MSTRIFTLIKEHVIHIRSKNHHDANGYGYDFGFAIQLAPIVCFISYVAWMQRERVSKQHTSDASANFGKRFCLSLHERPRRKKEKSSTRNYIAVPHIEIWESKLILPLILSILFILFILWFNIQGKHPLCNKQLEQKLLSLCLKNRKFVGSDSMPV